MIDVGTYAEAVRTAIGFFWKAGWAFVLGYAISAAIQAFVPKARLTRYMGDGGLRGVSLATLFGAISSSCSFAALATARALVLKGAHFVAAIAFMFASTNLVVELGILIFIFLGWQFLLAEIAGGVLLIAVSTLLIRATYPTRWIEQARDRVEEGADDEEDDFDWRERIRSLDGWTRVGRRFAMEWQMVWREILVGFTLAGFIAVYVPERVWEAVFLVDGLTEGSPGDAAGFFVVLENAAVAPFVAAMTFIGSMGNIPLATVLASGGVTFAGIMGFIYSDLMVPPLVKVNAKYYGWPVALYIAAVMYASIVVCALVLHYAFTWAGIVPESGRRTAEIVQFGVDYTLFMNLAASAVVAVMLWLRYLGLRDRRSAARDHGGDGRGRLQAVVTYACMAAVAAGVVALLVQS